VSITLLKSYIDSIRISIAYRKTQNPIPNVSWIVFFVVILNFGYIFLSIIFPPAGKPPAFHFANELGAITALSAIYLSMASAFSVSALVVNIGLKSFDILLWIILAIVFALLSLDELMQFHERIGKFIRGYASSGIFRGWNDVIVILYGLIALPFIAIFLQKLLRYRNLIEFFAAAFIFYGIHTFIDSTQQPQTIVSVIFEESFKLFCGSMLAVGALVGFLGSFWNFKTNVNSTTITK
jgi:hypothetical protein